MRIIYIACLLTYAAFGQAPETRTIALPTSATVDEIRDYTLTIRRLTQIQDVVLDEDRRTLTLTGAPSALALAEWTARELDTCRGTTFKASDTDIARAFPVAQSSGLQQFHELATLVRSIADVRLMVTSPATRMMFVRATPAQVALVDWMVQQIDKGADSPDEYQYPDPAAGVVRLFHLPHPPTVQSFQEAATLMRTLAEIPRVFTLNDARVIAVRGTPKQVALSAWLVPQLDQPAATAEDRAASHEFRVDPLADDIAGIVYLEPSLTVAAFQQRVMSIRQTARSPRVFTLNGPRLIAVRGTAAQISAATNLAKHN